jgi:O-antigen/teichoic acid export membrane protein
MIWFIPIGWINSLTNYVLIALDQQRPMRWAFALGVSFNVVANLLFIPLYSFQAAAVITIFSEVVLLVAFYWLLRRALAPVPWIAMLWKPVLAALVMIGMLMALWSISPVLAMSVGSASYPAVLVVLRPFSAWELSQIGALLPGRVRQLVRVN